jgi:hypothetical protein
MDELPTEPVKKRGRPITGARPLMNFRIDPELLGLLDLWIYNQPDRITRSQAIRSILKDHLTPPTEKENDDRAATLQYLLDKEKRLQYLSGGATRSLPSLGQAALSRVLRWARPDRDVLNQLANVFEDPGSTRMKAILMQRGPGNRSRDVEQSVELIRNGREIERAIENGAKRHIAVEDFSKNYRKSKAKAYKALRATERAKAVRDAE